MTNTLSMRALALAVFVMAALPLAAFAFEMRSGEQPSVPRDEAVQGDLYIAGGSVLSAGTINGDLLAAGGSILVQGPVSADAMIAGGSITVSSDVRDDLRVAGGTLILSGTVEGDLVAAGGQLTVSGGRHVGGDAALAGGTVRIETPVSGDLHIAGGDVYVNAPIGGVVIVYGDRVALGPDAVLAKTFTYHSAHEATIDPEAVVMGETTYTATPDVRERVEGNIAAIASLWFLGKFLAILVCALVVGLIFKRYSLTITEVAFAYPLREFGRGLIALIALPVLSVVLLVSIIGTPLGVLGLLGFAVVAVFGGIVAPILLGSVIYRSFAKRQSYEVTWKTILIGTVVYFLFGLIPIVGWLAVFFFFVLAVGAAVKVKWDIANQWR